MWVIEIWLISFVENKEILLLGYVIYWRDWGSCVGGVLLVVKVNFFSFCCEIVDLNDLDLEIVFVELIIKFKVKILVCCCYRILIFEKDWLDKLNIYLVKCLLCYGNMLIVGDFNFFEIYWELFERSKGVDEVVFVE